MRIVTAAQQKGGVGKSALTIHLGVQAFFAGKKVAILDMDVDQQTAAKWGKRRVAAMTHDRFQVFVVQIHELEARLAMLREEGFDWCFIDLPGRTAGAGSAIIAANFVIMPVRPLDVDVEASERTLTAVSRAEKPYAYLMNICAPQDNASRARKVADALKAGGCNVAPTIIIQRVIVPDAIATGRHAGDMPGGEQSASEFASLFQWLDKEITDRDQQTDRSVRSEEPDQGKGRKGDSHPGRAGAGASPAKGDRGRQAH
jgi:chromosome partitioning protein